MSSITLTGRLTADPELRFGSNGTAVAKFTVVTSRRKKVGDQWEDADTTFWDCVAFKALAENVCESLTKGSAVVVAGKAAQRSWETKEGEKRSRIEVTVDDIGPSLRNATARVAKVSREGGGFTPEADPWATSAQTNAFGGSNDAPPF